MTKLSSAIQINAPKERVWAVLADLGAASAWNPTVTHSSYTSDGREGVGASRRCDLPDGSFVEERVTAWTPGEAFTLNVYEGAIPFENGFGTYELRGVGSETIVNFTLEFDSKADGPMTPEEVERLFTEEIIPAMLSGLKHYVETGQPLPVPPATEVAIE